MTILQNYINNIHDYRYDPQAIADYQFPPAMSAKLMQEQKWSAAYTTRVLAEYRRFIHLAATAGHEVTPSQIVDEAWHMHLTFSRDYWEKLVPLLPAPLHHEPGTGEAGDTARYADQYRRTLADYRAAFGQEPPADIWPTPQTIRPQTSRPRRRRNNWPTALGVGVAAIGVLAVMNVNLVVALVLATVIGFMVNQFAGAWSTGSGSGGAGGSCGGASCGFVGGDSCDVGGDGGCSDSGGDGGGGDCGGGDGGSCGGGCGGGCGS